jgi:hypothetical protein
VADKLTHLITEALTRAAAEPSGLPLYAGKTDPGLFVSSSVGKSAAQKCLNEGFIRINGSAARGKTARDLYSLTENGWNFLLTQVNPKQVLEDFVRVLEARHCEVGELLDIARRMAENLQGLKDAVIRILPTVIEGRVSQISLLDSAMVPLSPTPSPRVRGEEAMLPASSGERGLGREGLPKMEDETAATAVLEAHHVENSTALAAVILARLGDWSGAAGEDCPLPRLFDSLSVCEHQPTIGEFHDCLRQLKADGAIYLHPWTGPLYALPEPAYALLVGHNIAYYASVRYRP